MWATGADRARLRPRGRGERRWYHGPPSFTGRGLFRACWPRSMHAAGMLIEEGSAQSMLVVMRLGSSPDEIEAIRSRARQAGAQATVFEAVGRTVVGMDGEVSPGSRELLETLQALPGVE